jgi:hypothetical protein
LEKEGIEAKIMDGLWEKLTPLALCRRLIDEKPEFAQRRFILKMTT